MRVFWILLLIFGIIHPTQTKEKKPPRTKTKIQNPLIDYAGFQKIVNTSSEERESKRLSEEEFLKALEDKEAVILDARSESRYKLRHIRGAINLPFTEFTKESLTQIIPNLNSKILIYCNNNFGGSPAAFAAKSPPASLNLSTYVSLKAYGYTNIYELGPLLDVATTKLPFEGSETD
ncbi:rhodanese-like domain-containing protein [Leptospira sp. WS92.C1]